MEYTDQEANANANPLPDDIEQNFLTQFSSMVTTDKDELIRHFQSIGENVNLTTATFFLDMTNWNLQAAVGCYFDYMAQSRQPSMRLLNDITVGKGEKITPNTAVKLTWLLQNNGEISWPSGTYVALLRNPSTMPEDLAPPTYEDLKHYVPTVVPDDSVVVSVQLVTPATEGLFETVWCMYTPSGTSFGDKIINLLEVSQDGTMAVTQQYASMQENASNETALALQNAASVAGPPQQTSGDPDDSEMWG
uniref:Nbr1 FW domain-containing protein n=1 Tax=Anopheles farauti TaxID=69004 RepID=A0A182QQ61_9DIPT